MNKVKFTVTLELHDSPVGITISGTENRGDPILISGLQTDGLADRSKLFFIGDEITAVNGHQLKNKSLFEVVELLRESKQTITLSISRGTSDGNSSSTNNTCCDLGHSSCPSSEMDNWSDEDDNHPPETEDIWSTSFDRDILKTSGDMLDDDYGDSVHGYKHSANKLPKTISHFAHNGKAHNSATRNFHSQLLEVENELSQILTPAPAEVMRLMLQADPEAGFGFSLSDGVYEKGVYVSDVLVGGPAFVKGIKPFDRLLQVNDQPIGNMSSSAVVNLIRHSQHSLFVIVCRNPLSAGSH